MRRPPLSVRHDEAALEQYQALHDGIPKWMLGGVYAWSTKVLRSDSDLMAAEQYFRERLDWSAIRRVRSSTNEGVAQLLGSRGLDFLDYCLGIANYGVDVGYGFAEELQEILDRSGSAWKVGTDPEGRKCLERRVDATVLAAADREKSQRSKAAEYLRTAWHHLYGRDPDSSAAYRDAVRAVEAAARPVVTPKDHRATLGKMIVALNDKPEKWDTVIGDVDTVRKMMKTIWESQSDRHGTDDPAKPRNLSQPEAESAVQMAVTLVHLFRTGAIRFTP